MVLRGGRRDGRRGGEPRRLNPGHVDEALFRRGTDDEIFTLHRGAQARELRNAVALGNARADFPDLGKDLVSPGQGVVTIVNPDDPRFLNPADMPAAMQAAAIGEMRRVLRPGGRIVLVDLQRPKTFSAALSLVTLFHQAGSHATAPDWQDLELKLERHDIHILGRHAMGGGAVGAIVGRNGGNAGKSAKASLNATD